MSSKILINDASPNETRVALISKGELIDFDLQSNEHFRTKSNIYKGVVARVEPSLEAVFVNYGETKNGFLPIKEINSDYLPKPYRRNDDIRDLIQVGQEMIVQVVKEARKDKGAALTTYITIASRSVVLNRGYNKKINLSRNIRGEDRNRIHNIINDIGMPERFSAIVRTSATGLSSDEIKWDMDYLLRLWDGIKDQAREISEPALILRESDVITRTIRDRLNEEIEEVLVDTPEAFESVKTMMNQASPSQLGKLSLYSSGIPLFVHYGIEKTVRSAFMHRVGLPSGGELVIDRTEAMFIIDVNSFQSNKGSSVEDTALINNLEAVKEIARQMRIRDIGGLMVIDFIDMMRHNNNFTVENAFKEEIKKDKAYVRTSNISRFGMMEVSRQRLRSSLDEFYLEKCSHCDGTGARFTLSATTGNLFRGINEMLQNSMITKVECRIPAEVNEQLNKFYGEHIAKLKDKYQDKLNIEVDANMEVPNYNISYTNVSGVTNEADEHGNNPNDSTSDRYIYEDVNRKPLIKAYDVLNEVPPNKTSFLSKIFGIIKKIFSTDSKKSRRGSKPGGKRTRYNKRYAGSRSKSRKNNNRQAGNNYRNRKQRRNNNRRYK